MHSFINSHFFEFFILSLIISNIIVLAWQYEEIPLAVQTNLDLANSIFTGFFIAEAVLKIVTYGVFVYIHSNWNKYFNFQI